MSQHPRDTHPIEWLKTENMLLGLVLKAMLSKLPPEVTSEAMAALTGILDLPTEVQSSPAGRFAMTVAADLMARLDWRNPDVG